MGSQGSQLLVWDCESLAGREGCGNISNSVYPVVDLWSLLVIGRIVGSGMKRNKGELEPTVGSTTSEHLHLQLSLLDLKIRKGGQQNEPANKGTCRQAGQPEFNS